MKTETTTPSGCSVAAGSAPWSEQKRKRHREYMRTWNKNNRDKVNGYLRESTRVHSVSPNKGRNRRSWKYAAHARKPWGVVEDALLFSGKTESELVKELGRSLLAIQRRKWRLRQEDSQYSPNTKTTDAEAKR